MTCALMTCVQAGRRVKEQKHNSDRNPLDVTHRGKGEGEASKEKNKNKKKKPTMHR